MREEARCAAVRLVALSRLRARPDRTAGYAAGFDAFLVRLFDVGRSEQELRERG